MDVIKELIRPELLVLIPVLYWIGVGLKGAAAFPDRWIPVALGIAGMVLASVYVAATAQTGGILLSIFTGVAQGVLCAASAVYTDQIVKQAGKKP